MNPLELLFRDGNQIIFLPSILLKLDALEFIVPVDISIRLEKKLVITEVYGANFSVKEDFGIQDYRISLNGKIGNTDVTPAAKLMGLNKKVDALDFLSKLAKLTKKKGALEVTDVSSEFAGNFIRRGVKAIDQLFDLPFGGPKEPEGILNKLGIKKVVIKSYNAYPAGGGHFRFQLELISDMEEEDLSDTSKLNLFLKESEE